MDGDVIDADGQVECIDIDECAEKTHECSPNAQCETTQVPWFLIIKLLLALSFERHLSELNKNPHKVNIFAHAPNIILVTD